MNDQSNNPEYPEDDFPEGQLPEGFTLENIRGDLRYGNELWNIIEKSSIPHEVVTAMRVAQVLLEGGLITKLAYEVLDDYAKKTMDQKGFTSQIIQRDDARNS